jgi:hypothetical protein
MHQHDYGWRTICLGGELAISTDKLHQRGLVYNTWLPINGIFMERDRLGRLHCSVFINQFKKYLLNKKNVEVKNK